MEYEKFLILIIGSLIVLAISPTLAASKRHHAIRKQFSDDSPLGSEEDVRYQPRGRRHGRGHGFHGHGHGPGPAIVEEGIPGFPLKGPPSAPFIYQQPGRGPDFVGGPRHRGLRPGQENYYVGNNFGPPMGNNVGQQFPLRTNNFPTNPNSAGFPIINGFGPASGNNNGMGISTPANSNFPNVMPFDRVPSVRDQDYRNPNNQPQRPDTSFVSRPSQTGTRPDNSFVPRPPQPATDLYDSNIFLNPRPVNNGPSATNLPPGDVIPSQPALKPNQFVNINNPPAIQPVTNDLPLSEKPNEPHSKPTINPRTFDLLHGSNLFEETTTIAPPLGAEAEDRITPVFEPRMLLDGTVHCKEGQIAVGNTCRRRV